ncbi:PLAC8 family protein [Phytophthora cinnamomi]|uniref:PLAC8 family protein n=1 Tax=Phytophthora cinnamomi TaxID=4785 RepID=UPI00355A897E|nr:PLAC8 family protein [Phytophthora cinnamomi]
MYFSEHVVRAASLCNSQPTSAATARKPVLKMADLEAAKPYMIAVEEPKAGQAGEITTGKWEVGFCECCTPCVPNCLMTSCCPCVTLAQISARLDMMSFKWALLLSIVLLFIPSVGSIAFLVWIWVARKEMATHIKSYKPGSCAFGPQDTLTPYQRA